MAYTHGHTRQQMHAPPPPRRSGVNPVTLGAAAIAAVVAAVVVSRFWQSGTLMATAMTPVIVALVKELVERPAHRVSAITPRPPSRVVERAAPDVEAPPPPAIGRDELTQMRVYGRARTTPGRRWKLALVTGVLGFAICVGALTLPELVAGRSVVSGSDHTTIFGGQPAAPAKTTHEKTTSTEQHTTSTSTGEQQTKTETQPEGTTTQTEPQQTPTTTAPAPQSAAPQTTTPAPTETQAQPQPPPQAAPPATTSP
jgi:hypothetical protein